MLLLLQDLVSSWENSLDTKRLTVQLKKPFIKEAQG